MLCLQAEPRTLGVGHATFAFDGAIQEVAGIELHTRFGGGNFE